MNNGSVTAAFFAVTDAATKRDILQNIATHYGISAEDAHAEVTDREAESLLDYVTGPMRAAVSLAMRRHGLAA
jgi:predicted DsbA family dithiol-disulfide isomerase